MNAAEAAVLEVPTARLSAIPQTVTGEHDLEVERKPCPWSSAVGRAWRLWRPRLILMVTLMIGCGLIHLAAQPKPTGPAAGSSLRRPQHAAGSQWSPTSRRFRVATYNIHGAKGRDGRRDLARIARDLEGVDFVALNEVHGASWLSREDQSASLGDMLRMPSLFAPSARFWRHYDTGNGLLSALPLIWWQRVPLERHAERSFRNCVLAEVAVDHQPVRVLLTHVCRSQEADRQAQLRAVIALFLCLEEPAVLLGDLNSTAADPQLAALLARGDVEDAVGGHLPPEEAAREAFRIDWILTRGLRSTAGGVVESGASDHPLVWAELQLMEEDGS
ncbi:MAG: endonuclease/exonuclease/phosphatase family protein [Planctomycetota bacterium]